MSDARDRRVAALIAAAKAKTGAKTSAAEHAIRTLIKRSEPVTFQAVQRQAGVSHAFLYAHPELRARIETLRAQNRPPRAETAPPDTDSTLVLALTGQIDHLKRQHRHEVQALRTALEQAHGENLTLRRQLAVSRPATTNDHVATIATTP
jgi:hypothetical protein